MTCHTVWAVQARRLGDFAYSTTMYGHLLGTTGQMLCEDGEQAGDDDLASGVCLKHVNGCKRCIQHYPTILRWNFIIRLPHGDMSQFLSPRVHLPKYFRGYSWGGLGKCNRAGYSRCTPMQCPCYLSSPPKLLYFDGGTKK